MSPRLIRCSSFSRGGGLWVVITRRSFFFFGIGSPARMPFHLARSPTSTR
ncbi:hypothetical protein [Nannocystis pusilla]